MGDIIISMPKKETAKRIVDIIRNHGLDADIMICSNASTILREANSRNFGGIICSSELADMNYAELADYIPPGFGMIVLTKDASLEIVSDKMLRLVLPLSVRELIATIQTVLQTYDVPTRKKKPIKPKRSPEEQKTIDNAKAVLMELKHMTEPEAFRYMQKQAMDTQRTMLEEAQLILLLNSDWSS